MNTDHAIVEEKGHIMVITLNRPEERNALSPGMLCLLYTSPSPRDATLSRMPSSA